MSNTHPNTPATDDLVRQIVAEWDVQHDAWASGETTSPSTTDRALAALKVLGVDPEATGARSGFTQRNQDVAENLIYDLECDGGLPVDVAAAVVEEFAPLPPETFAAHLLVTGSTQASERYYEGYAVKVEAGACGENGEVNGEYVGRGRPYCIIAVRREQDVDYLIGRLNSGLYGARRIEVQS